MIKKVFAIIGIVLGSITAFIGAVVGVLALMGKFKIPDVYPDVLQFETNIRVVDKYIQLPDYTNSDLYSFTLAGINNDESLSEYEVNQKECDLWFVDNVGASLIQLCDKDGKALVAENNKYTVNCNEPIYYKVISLLNNEGKVDNNINDLDGVVKIQARHKNERVQSNILTIEIDRKINSVSLVDDGNLASLDGQDKLVQYVQIGTNIRKDLKFLINPEKSLTPLDGVSSKIIELYFDDVNDEGTDLVPVNEETILTNNTLKKMIAKDDEGNLYFYVDINNGEPLNINDNYEFKIATFDTYAAREEFEANELNSKLTNMQRIGNMLVTSLTIDFVNSNVANIALENEGFSLNLFSDNDYISLNTNNVLDLQGYPLLENTSKVNNLEFKTYLDGGTEIDLRHNEAQFANYKFKAIDNLENLVFLNYATGEQITEETLVGGRSFNECVNLSDISIIVEDVRYTIINNFTDSSSNSYYCAEGVMAKDESGDYYTLSSGVYLDFYKYNNVSYVTDNQTTFKYNIEHVENSYGINKAWKIISLNEVSEDDSIYIGALVINNDGTFNKNNFFKTTQVTCSQIDLAYTLPSESETYNKTLNITYNMSGANCEEVKFTDIVKNVVGSYNALVFGVPVYEAYDIEVLWKDANTNGQLDVGEKQIYTINGTPYYIVGKVNANGKFENVVKIKQTAADKEIKLHLIQIKNTYDSLLDYSEEKESTYNSKIHNIVWALENDISALVEQVITDVVTLQPKQIFNTFGLTVKHNNVEMVNSLIEVYQTSENTITITTEIPNMLKAVFDFYNLGEDDQNNFNNYIKSNNSNLKIKRILFVENDPETPENEEKIQIDYVAETYSNTEINIVLAGMGAEDFDIGPIKIISAAPTTIVYKTINNTVELSSDINSAKLSSNYIEYSTLKYVENGEVSAFYVSISLYSEGVNVKKDYIPLNTKVTADTLIGFQDKDGFKMEFDITYKSNDTSIFWCYKTSYDEYAIHSITTGEGILEVSFGGVSAYIKVVVTSNMYTTSKTNGFAFEINGEINSETYNYTVNYDETFKLSDFVNLYYIIDSSDLNNIEKTDNLLDVINTHTSISNVRCISYGDGVISVSGNAEEGYEFKDKNGNSVLNIVRHGRAWEFSRENSKYVPIIVSFDVVTRVGKIEVNLTISSEIQVTFNSAFWKEKTIYQGTTVEVFEQNDANKEAILNINNATSDVSVEIYKDSTKVTTLTTTKHHTFDGLGTYKLEVYMGGSKIQEIAGFNVVPNIVATRKDVELTSESSGDLTNIFTLKYFTTSSVIYGSDSASYYNADGLNPQNTHSSAPNELLITSSAKNENGQALITSSEGSYDIGALNNIDTIIDAELTLNYNNSSNIPLLVYIDNIAYSTVNVPISNIHSVDVDEASLIAQGILIESGEERYYELMSLKEYDQFVSVTGYELQDVYFIKDGNQEHIFINNKVYINTINKEYTNTEVVFVFSNGTNNLIYKHRFNILPYTPDEISAVAETNEKDFDLLTEILDVTSLPTEVNKLIVNGIFTDESFTNNITSLISANFNENGYNIIYGNAACLVDINDKIVFNGLHLKEQIVYVKYTITYSDNSTYEFSKKLTIKNRQTVTLQYPEVDNSLRIIEESFKFGASYTNDGINISGATSANANNAYTIKDIKYEPVLTYTNKTTSINFKYDNFKSIQRALVEGTGDNNEINIVKIAYENSYRFDEVFNAVTINLDNDANVAEVILPSMSAGTNGFIMFKISSESGYYEYYTIYVYCLADVNVDSTSNLVLNASFNDLNNSESIISDSVDSVVPADEFKDEFGVDYDSNYVEFYLLSVTALGLDDDYILDSTTRYNKLDLTSLKTALSEPSHSNKYITIKLSVVFTGETLNQYNLGTITLVVTPDLKEVLTSVDKVSEMQQVSAISTGEYTAIIDNNATTIGCPFGSGYTVEIDRTGVAEAANDEILLNRVLDEDYLFVATYTNSSTGLVVKVNYTYKATILPNSQLVDKEIGAFNNDVGFEKTFVIVNSSKTNIAEIKLDSVALLGNYTGAYTVSCEAGKVTFDNIEKLTFELTNVSYTTVVEITYTNLNYVTRTFTFNVKAGYSEVRTPSGTSGLDANARMSTLLKENSYNEAIGSTITVNEVHKPSYYEYTFAGANISGLTIYTETDSSLEISFNESNYLINSGVVSEQTITGPAANINFIHLAENKNLTMFIKVKYGDDNIYHTYTLYLTVVKTYSGLRSVYITKDATHENVVGGTLNYDIYNNLFTSINNPSASDVEDGNVINNYRVILLDVNGNPATSFNYNNMGFNVENNPNKVAFSFAPNTIGVTLKSNNTKLDFSETNALITDINLYIYNDAGISAGDIVYKYQITPTMYNSSDDVDTTKTDTLVINNTTIINNGGFVGEDYVSYTKLNNELVIGNLNDSNNDSSLYLTGVKFNNDPVFNVNIELDVSDPLKKVYTITKDAYTLTLTYYKNTKLLTCQLTGLLATNSQVIFTIDLFGTTNYVVKDFNLVFTNITVESDLTRDNSIYAGYEIYLIEDGKIKVDNSVDLALNLEKSKYNIGGTEYDVTSNTTSLFKYTQNTKHIQTYSVGLETCVANLTFDVLLNDIVVSQATYNFQVKRNLQLVVDDAAIQNSIDKNSPQSNFQLTGTEFPITKTFTTTVSSPVEGRYETLSINLYTIVDQYSQKPERHLSPSLKYSLKSNVDGVNIVNDKITFSKDFSGDIEVVVEVSNIANGRYYIVWNIKVYGLNTFTPTAETVKIIDSGRAFDSGETITLVSNLKNVNAGVVMVRNKDVAVEATIEGKYIAANVDNQDMLNSVIYENGTSFTVADSPVDMGSSNSIIKLNLPVVPSCDVETYQSYFVVYKITFNYASLGANAHTFYIAYEVVNYAKVTINNSNVDLDNELVNSTGEESGERTYLDLFYYAEKYDNSNATLTLNASKELEITSGYTVDASGEVTNLSTGAVVAKSSTETKNTYSVFNCGFNKMLSFKAFIEKIDCVQIGDYYFKLYYLNGGRFGVNLNERYASKDLTGTPQSGAFIANELCADISVISDGIVGNFISAYSSTNTSGFKLTTENKLEAYNEETYYVSSIFMSTEVYPSEGYTRADILNKPVLAVIADRTDVKTGWVKGTVSNITFDIDGNGSNDNPIATIKVANGSDETLYYLHRVKYSNSAATGKLYSLTEIFYVIMTDTGEAKVVVRDYKALGVESTIFDIAFDSSKENQTLDLTKAFKVYGNDLNGLTVNSVDDKSDIKMGGIEQHEISISSNTLIEYKEAHPTETNYEAQTYIIKVQGLNLSVDVVFALPTDAQVEEYKKNFPLT